MSDLISLHFEDFDVRITDQDSNPWFVLADLCNGLNIRNPAQVALRLDPDEQHMLRIGSRGGRPNIIVSEPGLYKVVAGSNAAKTPGTPAHRFLRWITHEVLPSIRKYGFYDPARITALQAQESRAVLPRPYQRFMQEVDQYEARTGYKATTLPGLSPQKLKQIEQGADMEKVIGRDGLWLILTSAGFDLHYIMLGETSGERTHRDIVNPPKLMISG